ncbi:hypothetical protein N7468_009241 [Penicillium chermesinum]|uniref:AB hydrolase-1 domain-containing protein n=1 Tax=Penicillium chermesinum TaxID=63820 RepID=A0A9W9TEN8_9EURO|nr:uncharacterized protein N7468_009241 [Penicillium chermesinum]KAJ5220037.1 hypothetical protein N7468_009241 [Penicillium chermesinum]
MEASFSWETDRSVRVRPRPYPGTPVVILILGMGSTRSEWNPVRRRLARTTRLVSYDRCGLGISDPSPDARTAANMARELKDVLGSVNISPPYVILCHSFGGIIAREFAELLHDEHRSDVVGMVFVEANQEKSIALWPEYNLIDMAKGLDWFKEMGLHQAGILTDEDWKGVQDENENELHGQTVQREMENYARSCETLGIKNQLVRSPPVLRDCPVSVVKGYPELELRKVFNAAVRLGRGSDEQKKLVEEKLAIYPSLNDQFQRETLKLSTKGRFRDAIGCGHSIHMVRPDIITEEVEWVLEQARSDQFES